VTQLTIFFSLFTSHFFQRGAKLDRVFVCFRYCSSRYGDSRGRLIFHDFLMVLIRRGELGALELPTETYQSALGCVGDLEPAISTVKQLILAFYIRKNQEFHFKMTSRSHTRTDNRLAVTQKCR
jgi:hypothetical protein